MAKSNKAVFPQQFDTDKGTGSVTTAITATTRVWTNNCAVIYTAPADGAKIVDLYFKATGQVAACNVVVFLSDANGANFEPLTEEGLSTDGATPSATTKAAECRISFYDKELYLAEGRSIGFGITANVVTGKVVGYAVKGEYAV